jgi:serine/threonine protein phosphatase PrpC
LIKKNQVAISVLATATGGLFLGVYDGHGKLGHVASSLIRDTLYPNLCAEMNHKSIEVQLTDAIAKVDGIVKNVQEQETNMMRERQTTKKTHELAAIVDYGSTLVCCVLDENGIVTANIGDSRLVLYARDPTTQKFHVRSQTADHCTLTNPDEKARVEQLERDGVCKLHTTPHGDTRIYPAELNFSVARKHQLSLNITRSLGHCKLSKHGVVADPDTQKVGWDDVGLCDVVAILGSDGLWGCVRPEVVAQALDVVQDPKQLCQGLMKWCCSDAFNAQTVGDNVAVVCASIQKNLGEDESV